MREPLPRMVRVNAQRPCPVCQKRDWCLVCPTGKAAICKRVESDRLLPKDAGWLHRLEQPIPAFEPPPKRVRSSTTNWHAQAMIHARELPKQNKINLARHLGLPDDAMDCIGLLGQRKELSPIPDCGEFDLNLCFTFPEQDGSENVIGINRRYEDGRKLHIPGGARGLTIPNGWDQGEGPLYVVEGPTDTAAMLAAGLCAWGRPSNTGGVGHLADALSPLPEAVRCVIVGENDKKPDGLWPGLAGAVSVAGGLAKLVKQTVRWTLAPRDYKDVREYLTSEMFKGVDWKVRGQYLREELDLQEKRAEFRPDGYKDMIDRLKKTVGFDEQRWRY